MERRGPVWRDADVFVVGGGPAGLAAAIAAAARGLRVIVADGANPPIAKACGEGLLPNAVAALAEMGIVLGEEAGCALRGILFEDETGSVGAKFRCGYGIGMRRETLHQLMIDRASDCGVSLMWNTPVTALFEDGVLAGGNKVRARWTVGADGIGSRVRSWIGLESRRAPRNRFAFRQHYRLKPWTEFIEIHWSDLAQAYVTPVGPEDICVVMISSDSSRRFEKGILGFPKLMLRLSDAPPSSSERGAVTSMFELKRTFRENVALIGDASGSVDAITGEGLALSFQQARVLADALVAGDLGQYQEAHRRLARRPRFMGNLLLLLARQSGIRERTLRTLGSSPALYERMLAYHVGEANTLQLATTGANFGWRFLTA